MVTHTLCYPFWTRLGGPNQHRLAYTLALAFAGLVFAGATRRLRPSVVGSSR
jgi:hypothetical protein